METREIGGRVDRGYVSQSSTEKEIELPLTVISTLTHPIDLVSLREPILLMHFQLAGL